MKRLSREDEVAMVQRCADGDREAWGTFVKAYGPLLRALARRMLMRRTGQASDPDVDEVVADVFLALLRRERVLLHRFNPAYRLSTYLGVICRTEVLRMLRRHGRRPREAAELGHVPDHEGRPGPAQALAEQERDNAIASVREALSRLSDRDRLLLTLRFLDGLDYRAIAATLSLNAESVGQLLTRAKTRLRKEVPHLEAWLQSVEGDG